MGDDNAVVSLNLSRDAGSSEWHGEAYSEDGELIQVSSKPSVSAAVGALLQKIEARGLTVR